MPFLTPTVRPVTGLVFLDLQANIVKAKFTRKLPEIEVPGRSGNPLQDLGSKAVKYTVTGSWIYENMPKNLFGLNEIQLSMLNTLIHSVGWNWLRVMDMQLIYEQGQPLIFGCSFAPLTVVMIADMEFVENGGIPNKYDYKLELVEYSTELRLIGHGIGAIFGAAKTPLSWASRGLAGPSLEARILSSVTGKLGSEFGNLGY